MRNVAVPLRKAALTRGCLWLVVAAAIGGCGGSSASQTWSVPEGNVASTRVASHTRIRATNVGGLRVAWRFRFPGTGGSGVSSPVSDGTAIYVQAANSRVFALDPRTGHVLWTHRTIAPSTVAGGLAAVGGRVFGTTDDAVFALAAPNGRELWRRRLTNAARRLIAVAPIPWQGGLVFVDSAPANGRGRNVLFALDQATGKTRWTYGSAATSDARSLVSVDPEGRLYATITAPDELVALDAASGKPLWSGALSAPANAPPILEGSTVFVDADGGVHAWNATSQRREWARDLPSCASPSNASATASAVYVSCGARLVALGSGRGRGLWSHTFLAPVTGCATVANDVVVTATSDGRVFTLATRTGRTVWSHRAAGTIAACPAVVGNELVVPTVSPSALVAFAVAR